MLLPRRSIQEIIDALASTGYRGKAWRVHWQAIAATDWNLSLRTTGRYHRGRDLFPASESWPALYTSLAPEIAMWEMVRRSASRNLDYLMNNVLSELQINLTRVLDLTASGGDHFGEENLTGSDTRLCQEIAAYALEKKYEALIVPSAALPGNNLVVLPENLIDSSAIQAVKSTPLSLDTLRR